jgi:hypothetical protein
MHRATARSDFLTSLSGRVGLLNPRRAARLIGVDAFIRSGYEFRPDGGGGKVGDGFKLELPFEVLQVRLAYN